jgi:hypothetical protein
MDKETYGEAIRILAVMAQGDTGGARVAAQVLLSAHNGSDFQLNLVDLGNLDDTHYQAALAVIRGRTELRAEPAGFLENGDKVMQALWDQWQRYHVTNRGKPTCDLCWGAGVIPEYPDDESNYSQKTCTQCEGKGYYG